MYFAHVVFSYLVMIAGFGCLFSRFLPHTQWTHAWFGKLYFIAMLWAMGTSLLIHNSGLPAAVLISFVWVLAGMTIGWPLIALHQRQMQAKATKAVFERIQISGQFPKSEEIDRLVAIEKGKIAAAKSFKERMLSYKAAHGALMVVSWINIIGRVFVTPLGKDFTCYTATYYKQIDTKHFAGANVELTPLPTHDPNFAKLPWVRFLCILSYPRQKSNSNPRLQAKTGLVGWGILLSVVPIIGCYLIGSIWACVSIRRNASSRAAEPVAAEEKPKLDATA